MLTGVKVANRHEVYIWDAEDTPITERHCRINKPGLWNGKDCIARLHSLLQLNSIRTYI